MWPRHIFFWSSRAVAGISVKQTLKGRPFRKDFYSTVLCCVLKSESWVLFQEHEKEDNERLVRYALLLLWSKEIFKSMKMQKVPVAKSKELKMWELEAQGVRVMCLYSTKYSQSRIMAEGEVPCPLVDIAKIYKDDANVELCLAIFVNNTVVK